MWRRHLLPRPREGLVMAGCWGLDVLNCNLQCWVHESYREKIDRPECAELQERGTGSPRSGEICSTARSQKLAVRGWACHLSLSADFINQEQNNKRNDEQKNDEKARNWFICWQLDCVCSRHYSIFLWIANLGELSIS